MINFLKKTHILILASTVYIVLALIKLNSNLIIHMPVIIILLTCEILINELYSKQIKTEIEQKETFVAGIVHDLKNPIVADIRILENLIKRENLSQYNLGILKQLLCSDKLMLEMIVSVLNTYKYSAGQINYNFAECNLTELVSNTCKELTSYTDEEEFFKIKTDSNDIIIFADKVQLKRVIANLISNAIKYKKENSKILIEINHTNKYYKFSITNSGNHIPLKIQNKLFDKYVSGASKFNNISSGLGLYLSKKIINDHCGEITVHSTKDGLNTFSFTLPKNVSKKSGNNIQPNNLLHQKDVTKISELYPT